MLFISLAVAKYTLTFFLFHSLLKSGSNGSTPTTSDMQSREKYPHLFYSPLEEKNLEVLLENRTKIPTSSGSFVDSDSFKDFLKNNKSITPMEPMASIYHACCYS